jgi:hypothetical protein
MERMEVEVDSSKCRKYQHFTTNSNWDHSAVFRYMQRRLRAGSPVRCTPSGYGPKMGVRTGPGKEPWS